MNPDENPFDDPFGAPVDDSFDVDLGPAGAIPDGDYEMCLTKLEKSIAQSGNAMWVWTYSIADSRFLGRDLPAYTALSPNALWKVAEHLEAHGVKPPEGTSRVSFSKNDLLGTYVLGTVVNEEYEGRTRPAIRAVKKHPKGAGYRPVAEGLVP